MYTEQSARTGQVDRYSSCDPVVAVLISFFKNNNGAICLILSFSFF
jgi:hypothetical protein